MRDTYINQLIIKKRQINFRKFGIHFENSDLEKAMIKHSEKATNSMTIETQHMDANERKAISKEEESKKYKENGHYSE